MNTSTSLKNFKKEVFIYYKSHKRSLPWRYISDPYKILVSEIMLQQTQVDRVIPFYQNFITHFPTIESLAKAPLKEVLQVWSGLGYNRRAKNLHSTAKMLVKEPYGQIPTTISELMSLPGIGPYTAGAILAFAFNIPETIIETNIRSVFIHHFFLNKNDIHDSDLLPLITKTLDKENPREWYYALMDYGTHIKKVFKNPSLKSKHHQKQEKFRGSDRELRGEMIRLLIKNNYTEQQLHSKLKEKYKNTTHKRVCEICFTLLSESLISLSKNGTLSIK